MQNIPKYIREAFDEIAENENLIEYSLHFELVSQHGDNLQSVPLAVKLHGKRLVNDELTSKTLHLFCKNTNEDIERRRAFNTVAFFKREIFLYTTVLPTFRKFQKEKGLTDDELFRAYPKCYLTIADDLNERYLLILEDLRVKGYEMHPKEMPMNFSEMCLFFTELAKLHGISIAMKDQRPELFAPLKQLNDICD